MFQPKIQTHKQLADSSWHKQMNTTAITVIQLCPRLVQFILYHGMTSDKHHMLQLIALYLNKLMPLIQGHTKHSGYKMHDSSKEYYILEWILVNRLPHDVYMYSLLILISFIDD